MKAEILIIIYNIDTGFVVLVTKLCPTPWDPMDLAHQNPLSMGFSRQQYWSGLPFPSPGDTPKPGTESVFPILAGGFFTTEPNREAHDKLNSTHQ